LQGVVVVFVALEEWEEWRVGVDTKMSAAVEDNTLSATLQSDCQITDKKKKPSYRPKSSSLPTSLVSTIQLDNNDTTIILQLFADRIFISITQLSGKMGSLLHCTVEESIIDNSTTYNVSTVLGTGTARGGNADNEVAFREVYVRRLAEKIVLHTRKMAGVSETTILGGLEDGSGPIPTLVVGLGLRPSKDGKRMSVDSFNTLVDAAMGLYEEGWKISNAGGMIGMEGPD